MDLTEKLVDHGIHTLAIKVTVYPSSMLGLLCDLVNNANASIAHGNADCLSQHLDQYARLA